MIGWSSAAEATPRWSASAGPSICPEDLNDVETAEGLGAQWEGDELVVYDLPGFTQLLAYDSGDEYQIDND